MRDPLQALQWEDGVLWILDQRQLPAKVAWIRARTAEQVAQAIETLAVRGAPAIGVAAAYGVLLAARLKGAEKESVLSAMERLSRTRPTAYNLFDALNFMRKKLNSKTELRVQQIEAAAARYHENDRKSCLRMAKAGLPLFEEGESVLTYCHTGALATGGIGTALGVIKHAYAKGRIKQVYACETRPVGQGGRLTVWECSRAGVPVTLICDNMAGALMRSGKVQRVLTGADRIARNGDSSNKIGTYTLAVLAKRHRIPFHIVAPFTTIDASIASGKLIPIEERPGDEVLKFYPGTEKLAGVNVWNPAFDVTPAALITSIVTDRGVLTPPFEK